MHAAYSSGRMLSDIHAWSLVSEKVDGLMVRTHLYLEHPCLATSRDRMDGRGHRWLDMPARW